MNKEDVRKIVREGYAKVAKQEYSCCGPSKSCGCGGGDGADAGSGKVGYAEKVGKNIGYSEEEMNAVPEGANLGLGCGNPVALASLKEGETVLDLGSGAGFDCFLAAKKVGKQGRVIGVDMTAEMLEKARANAAKGGYTNVEFRLGEIENLPVADNTADIVISNCVINLSPDKAKVFREAFRALKPGGRVMVSDIVLLKELPAGVKKSVEAYIGCLSGAMIKEDYLETIKAAGFSDIKILEQTTFPVEFMANDPTAKEILKKVNLSFGFLKVLAESAVSLRVSAVK